MFTFISRKMFYLKMKQKSNNTKLKSVKNGDYFEQYFKRTTLHVLILHGSVISDFIVEIYAYMILNLFTKFWVIILYSFIGVTQAIQVLRLDFLCIE
ncbi:hypothetical protein KUTeg_016832 [Tegillarca granosa]|uniref:Uncharacterized protein n=1 Tax=Tegillarca granosa TaxID=220873 RepID=A0ABQ9EQU3_TEGGR|nr:hypothetical protein KUTeg_016832 [Tegillarca granosa]